MGNQSGDRALRLKNCCVFMLLFTKNKVVMTRGKSSEMEFVLSNRFARVASSRTKTENVIFAKEESRKQSRCKR